jgi:GNAT superfamily N-acetyltransferase
MLPGPLLQKLVEMPWPAPKNFFIASRNGRTIATIGANLGTRDPELGFIGFYECDLADPQAAEASRRLIAAAESFLLGKGAAKVLAPIDYCTWFPYRFTRQDSAAPFYSWEPVQPPEYLAHFQAAGYADSAGYISIGHDDANPFIEAHTPALKKAFALGYRLRPFDTVHFLERDVPILHRISMSGFADSFLFEPIALPAFRDLYVPIARKLDLSYCNFLLDPEGKEVGYLFAFFDGQNKDHFVIKTMTLLPEARGKGLSNALVCHAFRQGRDNGSKRTIHAMVRSDAQSRSYGRHVSIDWEHHYLLVEKTLQ